MKRFFYLSAVLFSMIAFSNIMQAQKITIMYTNDSHSNLLPGGPRGSDLKANMGGIAKLASVVGQEKAQGALFFHAGDISIGDLFYCKYLAIPELQILNQLGCNGLELGNHEFDLTPAYLTQVLATGNPEGNIPILCANADFSDPSIKAMGLDAMVMPYKIDSANGVKVGVFGLITPQTNELSMPDPVKIMDLNTTLIKAVEMIDTLRSKGCKVIILLSHLGYIYDTEIAKNIPGINFIIGGHDHLTFQNPELHTETGGKCYITQAGSYYQNVGKLVINVTGNQVNLESSEMIKLDETIPEEPNIKAALDAMIDSVEATYGPFYSQKIADCPNTLDESAVNALKVGNNDTPVGNLVAEAFKAWGNTDVGLTACGFTSQPLYKGSIIAADIYRMLGYGFNEVNALGFRMVKFDIRGDSLLAGIGFGLSQIFFSEDFLIQCSGMKYEYVFHNNLFELENNWGELVSAQSLPDGLTMKPDKYYSVTTTEGLLAYLNLLGIGYKNLQVNSDTTEFMVLLGYCSAIQTVSSASDGRVKCVLIDGIKGETILNKSETLIYPNPCTDNVSINFEIGIPGYYSFEIFNAQGQPVTLPVNEFFGTGNYTKSINTRSIPPGMYTFMLSSCTHKTNGRLVIVK